ncbi:sulfite exporter TauE/SafE family protein [Thetidibacter halocola]|uniref:Probable membrane transporter protein n=1 Tax=Thetidibacter halocola TaxID=2827239 RepID=A0A8J7WGZ3_9RHOB|nr:sulfite exporter TauE/SafE family protein [Thetidibacter halocola]MBS0125496.1 sulfite exporter TauE/SafE family protein [Thetidibacter halocola]
MELFLTETSPAILLLGLGVALVAGVVKGLVGFAMPMILISGLSTVLPPDQALAGLILPTLATNGMQALRQGWRAAGDSVRRFRVFLVAMTAALLVSAQLVAVLPADVLLLAIGGPVVIFAALQLAGWQPRLPQADRRVEAGVGTFAGAVGGVSGVWGPPTVLYLTALGTEKTEQMRVQGVIYGIGAAVLVVAHLGSGVLNGQTVWLSVILLPPAVLGMWLGGFVQDRIDQRAFRRATLFVLCVVGLNLLRRALF